MSLTPPDPERCQADVPGPGPFSLGWGPGGPGNPKDGYRTRCYAPPTVIVVESQPNPTDGLCGSMSLCASCLAVLEEQEGSLESFDVHTVYQWVEAQQMLVEVDE